jgi:hypothetical protein
LARLGDLAEDEERAIGLDLDRDVRLADVTLAQLVGYPARKLVGRRPARQHRADERHSDVATRVDGVGIGQALLAEHDDAQPVARVQSVGALIDERRIGHGGRDSDGAWRRRGRHGHKRRSRRTINDIVYAGSRWRRRDRYRDGPGGRSAHPAAATAAASNSMRKRAVRIRAVGPRSSER